MAYAIKVMVVDKKTRKGRSGFKVKCYGGSPVVTDKDGRATVICNQSNTEIYVDGFAVYKGSVSNAPNPIVVEK